jgi:arylsulfatase A-like enzyme
LIQSARFAPTFLVLAVLAGCGRSGAPRGIVLLTLDTTRADRLGCYGYAAAETPNLDAMASRGVLFEEAMASVPTTLASHSTMFTGEYPPVHGVRYNGMFRLGEDRRTVAEILHDAGWRTGAIPAAFPVHLGTGLEQGFEDYVDLEPEPGEDKPKATSERRADEVVNLALRWLDKQDDRPFFLWLHFFDPHSPYDPPFPYGAKFRGRPYDGEIAFADFHYGRFRAALAERGLSKEVVVIVAGDHGEGLYDHGERMHQNLVYQSTLHVPLIAEGPRIERGKRIEEPVTLADIAPTLLDLANVAVPEGMQGRSLVPSLRGAEPERRSLYFESLTGSLVYGWSPLEGLRRGPWKYIRSSDPELYDLSADAGEAEDVAARESQIVADMEGELASLLDAWSERAASPESSAASVSPEALAQLASLGYVGGAIATVRSDAAAPQAMVHLEGDLFLLRDLMLAGDHAGALVSAANVLAADPRNRFALHQAASAYHGMGNIREAMPLVDRLIELYPEFTPGPLLKSEMLAAREDFVAAEKVLREGLDHAPGDPVLLHPLALTLLAEDRAREALATAEAALAKPNAPPALIVVRAAALAATGDAAGAESALREAISKGYDDAEVLRTEPLLAPLRAIAGFEEIVSAIPARDAKKQAASP